MKYLKKIFEFSETHENIKKECEDILLELNDEGFKTRCMDFGRDPFNPEGISIEISKLRKEFTLGDINEVISRLQDYLNSKGFVISTSRPIFLSQLSSYDWSDDPIRNYLCFLDFEKKEQN